MRVSEAFPSKYLAADDLQDKEHTVCIDRIEFDEVGKERQRKPIVYFKNRKKGLVLNKINANNIAFAYGDEMTDWEGAEIILFPTMVDFQGKSVIAIRVKIPPRRPAMKQDAPASKSKASPYTGEVYDERNPPPQDDMNDSIEF